MKNKAELDDVNIIKILDYFYYKEHLFIVTELLKVLYNKKSTIYMNVSNKKQDILIYKELKKQQNSYQQDQIFFMI